jgi:hypothetical protein
MKVIPLLLILLFPSSANAGECKKFAELYGVDYYAKSFGQAYATTYRIDLWNTRHKTDGVSGRVLPGTNLLILERHGKQLLVSAPKEQGGTVGWIGAGEIRRVIKRDTETLLPCK